MSIERQRAILEQQLEEITEGIAELKRNRGENFSVKQLEKSKKSIRQKLDKLNDQTKKDDVVTLSLIHILPLLFLRRLSTLFLRMEADFLREKCVFMSSLKKVFLQKKMPTS